MDDLNRNQFVYKRELVHPAVAEDTENGIVGADAYTEIVYDSFNIDNVLRTLTMDDGRVIVLLDDIHERNQRVPRMNANNGNPVKNKHGEIQFQEVRETFQSEIYLSKEEGKQFLKLTAINNYG